MSLKIIDISALLSTARYSDFDRDQVSKELLKELLTTGFCYITGFDNDSSNDLFDLTNNFFSQTQEGKNLAISLDKARRGYSPSNTENFASLVGERRPNDVVEKFRMGPPDCNPSSDPYFQTKEARLFFYPNTWEGTPQRMKGVMTNYYHNMYRDVIVIIHKRVFSNLHMLSAVYREHLSSVLMKALEIGLQLPENFFLSKMNKHTSILTVNYFSDCHLPVQQDGESGSTAHPRNLIAQHTDVSMLTIVAQDGSSFASLEVLHNNGEWVLVPYHPNSYIVNIGDCLSDWTKGLLKSTLHRVRFVGTKIDSFVSERVIESTRYEGGQGGSSGSRSFSPTTRTSVAYFLSPDYDALMSMSISDLVS